jgi:hypothetical protein
MKVANDKDELIVRQSQMQRAIELCTLMDFKPSIKQVCRISQILTQFIFDWDLNNKDLIAMDKHITEHQQRMMETELQKILQNEQL